MERHATGRAECGATHGQDARLPVNILQREPERFPDAYSRDGQPSSQPMLRPGAQTTCRGEMQGGFQSLLNLCVCREIGACPFRAVREQTPRGNLSA